MTKELTSSKFIIYNKSSLTDLQAFKILTKVIEFGKISDNNQSYCFATQFYDFAVYVIRRKSGAFIIHITNK
jgi:hypothetical protein